MHQSAASDSPRFLSRLSVTGAILLATCNAFEYPDGQRDSGSLSVRFPDACHRDTHDVRAVDGIGTAFAY